MDVLQRRHLAHSQRGTRSDIRHYIGRLGTWTKAVRILILATKTFPQRIENAHVKVIGPYGPADLPNKLHITNLRDVVRRMVGADQLALLDEVSKALTDADAVVRVEDRFRDDYTTIKPRPHAELLVLEHFYSKGLVFVANDKYIGCSKPSCYCCHIYMQCHPAGLIPRPCHGNLWINWAPPIPLPLATHGTVKTTARPQEHHTFKLLQDMLIFIRRDLQEQILSRRPKRSRLPDSTTGMSSVLLESHKLFEIAARDLGQPNNSPQGDIFVNAGSAVMVAIDSETPVDDISQSFSKIAADDVEDHSLSIRKVIDKGGTSGQEKTRKDTKGKVALSEADVERDDEENNVGILLFKGRKKHLNSS